MFTFPFPFFPNSDISVVSLNKEFHGCKMKRRLIIDRVSRRKLCHPCAAFATSETETRNLPITADNLSQIEINESRCSSPISRRYLIRTRWPVSLNRRYALLVTVPRPFLLEYTAKRLEIIFTRVILRNFRLCPRSPIANSTNLFPKQISL